jgi:hypothetical protein
MLIANTKIPYDAYSSTEFSLKQQNSRI